MTRILARLWRRLKNPKPRLTRGERSEIYNLQSTYDLWASRYPPVAHNALMEIEQAAMLELMPDARPKVRALDLACGSGRYARILIERAARPCEGLHPCEGCEPSQGSVIGADFSWQMLARAREITPRLAQCDLGALPFADEAFDLIVCGLAFGHAESLRDALGEAARLLKRGGTLLYSDFHPAAQRAGLKRTFTAENGRTVEVPQHRYALLDHFDALRDARLEIEATREPTLRQAQGRLLRHPSTPLRTRAQDRLLREVRPDGSDLPIVLVVKARKMG